METSRCNDGTRAAAAGFSLAEILIAISVLAIGLTAMAQLVAVTLSGTERARYMAMVTTLCSEKLEDLNRYAAAAPQVAAGGSLSSDSSAGGFNYYDDVDMADTAGQVSESIAVSGGYSTISHLANGQVNTTNTAPAGGTAVIDYHRRWLIESNPVVNGITITGSRRVTVIVTATNLPTQPGASFQMSLIRP